MKVYYFSRTGRSEKIANEIARKHDMVANKIEDGINWKGPLNFVKGGYMAQKPKQINISYEEPGTEDEIVLVFPIWAGTFPPAVLNFIQEIGRERMIIVATAAASKLKDRDGFIEVYDLTGKELVAPEL